MVRTLAHPRRAETPVISGVEVGYVRRSEPVYFMRAKMPGKGSVPGGVAGWGRPWASQAGANPTSAVNFLVRDRLLPWASLRRLCAVQTSENSARTFLMPRIRN